MFQDWIPILHCKQNYFMAVAEYHQASVCVETGKYGEQVGRAQVGFNNLQKRLYW